MRTPIRQKPSLGRFRRPTKAIEAAKQLADNERAGPARSRGRPAKDPNVPVPFPKYKTATVSQVRGDEPLVVRRMVDGTRVIPMCHTHAIRAELEIEHYTRALYEEEWDIAVDGVVPTMSLPLLTFIDGFGVYRNSYRSLMGFYVTPAALCENDHCREANVFPIALGPHGSTFSDIVHYPRPRTLISPGLLHNSIRDPKALIYTAVRGPRHYSHILWYLSDSC